MLTNPVSGIYSSRAGTARLLLVRSFQVDCLSIACWLWDTLVTSIFILLGEPIASRNSYWQNCTRLTMYIPYSIMTDSIDWKSWRREMGYGSNKVTRHGQLEVCEATFPNWDFRLGSADSRQPGASNWAGENSHLSPRIRDIRFSSCRKNHR